MPGIAGCAGLPPEALTAGNPGIEVCIFLNAAFYFLVLEIFKVVDVNKAFRV